MFASAVWFERNLRRMGRAGWHDLTRAKDGESKSSGAHERDRGCRERSAATGSAPASTGARTEHGAGSHATPLSRDVRWRNDVKTEAG